MSRVSRRQVIPCGISRRGRRWFRDAAPKHGVQHFIETTGRPIFAKARRLDPDKLRTAESEFRALEKAGIVRRSNSQWLSPLPMVPKADGTWRPCGDYRWLNLATKHDRYPLPSILDLSSKLHGCRYFSVIDLVKGYHQVPMALEDIQKTAIITPFGLFEYLFMPFGLMNAAQTFQQLMDRLFGHFPFIFTYLDDHLIASKTLEEHMDHLSQFFCSLARQWSHHQSRKMHLCSHVRQISRTHGERDRVDTASAPCRRGSEFPTATGHQTATKVPRFDQFLP